MQLSIYIQNNFTSPLQEPIISYARKLRKEQTEAEKFLWNRLRGRKFHQFKFRRQHPIAKLFILDFYCCEIKLAIELDGDHHKENLQSKLDLDRTHVLNQLGIKVLRFTNEEVLKQTKEVLKIILDALEE
ncbi:MAG: endonuclease domain-containing protein [bacterium]